MFSFLSGIFANPLLAAGALAGSIPVIIHLLNRTKYKHVVWAAMHWLWASFKKTQRRIQIEQLLLLLLRVLILVLLALALARPALQHGVGLLAGQSAVHRVIVLDNSYSMGQRLGGRPMFERAKKTAEELASKMSLSDEVDVILSNNGYDDVLTTQGASRQDVLNAIKAAQLGDGGSDLPRSVAAACRLLNDRGSKYRREIVLITDMTRSAWEQSAGQFKRVSGDDEAAINKAFGDPRGKPRLIFARLRSEKDLDNIAAATLEVDEKIVPVNVDSQFVATVRAFTAGPLKDVRVKLKVDGDEVSSQTIATLTPQKPESVAFHHVFAEAGSHSLMVEIEAEGDVLPMDNSAFLAIDAQEQMKVLCVDGQQRVGANSSELDFFRQALAPTKSEEIQAGKMPLFPDVISDSALQDVSFDEYRLVILANVSAIPIEKVAALENFVKRGGALWIFPGDRVDPAIYNKDLAKLLPLQFGELTGSGDPSGEFEALSDKDISHPALEKFKGIKGLPLTHLQVFRRYKFVPGAADPSVRTVLSLENGEPLAVERRVGDHTGGRVLVFGTTADKAWNNFPAKNHYMPLMNFLALDLIQPEYIERNRLVGEKFTLQLPKQVLGAARREGLRLTDPAGDTGPMEILNEQFMAESTSVRKAGIFTTEVPGEKKRLVHFASNRNLEESDLAIMEDRELLAAIPVQAGAAGEKGSFFGTSVTQDDIVLPNDEAGSIEESIRRQGGSREIWRWLAYTVLAFLFLESLLAKRFGDFTR